jgi:hypothetical protein
MNKQKLVAILALGFALTVGCTRSQSRRTKAEVAQPRAAAQTEIVQAKKEEPKPSAFGDEQPARPKPIPVKCCPPRRLPAAAKANAQQSLTAAVTASAEAQAAAARRARELKEAADAEDAKVLLALALTAADTQQTALNSMVELAANFIKVQALIEAAEAKDVDIQPLLQKAVPLLAKQAGIVRGQMDEAIAAERLAGKVAQEAGINFEHTFEENAGKVRELLAQVQLLGLLMEASGEQ